MPTGQHYQFGAFRLDAGARVLFQGGERVALTPKAVDVLVALIEARDRPVTRDELLQTVWAGSVVEDGSLTSHISFLRKALGEGFIETLPKRGYRFVGQIEDEAIRTPPALRTNLPLSLTTFIGRREVLAQVGEQVRQSRMVTLVGAGGTGKTRLSLEAAKQLAAAFPDGVWLVELAPLTDAALVARAITTALGARAEGDTPPMTLIESTLREQRVLLLLDNCEHVIDEAATVAQTLLRRLPRLHLLATSRQPLRIEGETVYRVPSLSMPGAAGSFAPPDVIASEAGQLFVDRARAVQPGFVLTDRNAGSVAQVCQRLDGIPLAIELAAARLTALSVDEVAQRIDDRFRLLTGGLRTALPRQRTLRALVDWSYELLAAPERMVLDALSVFAGSFSLEAAERVAGGDARGGISVLDAVELLVAKSLLIAQSQEGAETRYRLLETIRQYAHEKLLDAGLADAVRQRHFSYFASVAETGAKELEGPLGLEWLRRLDAEHDNLRAALDGAADADPAGHARLAASLRFFWDIRGHFTEGLARLERACNTHTAHDAVRLGALTGAGLLAFRLAHAQRCEDSLGEAIALAREIGHLRGEAEATLALGHTRRQQGAAAAEPILSRAVALAKTAGDRRCETLARVELGIVAMAQGRYAEAQSLFLDSARFLGDAGCVIDAPSAVMQAGGCALYLLDFASARRLLGDSLAQFRRIGFVHEAADALRMLGLLALHERRLDEARALTAESLGIFRALHDPKCSALTAIHQANVLHAIGDGEAALSLAEFAAQTSRELGLPVRLAKALCTVGCIHATLGRRDAARSALFSGLIEQQQAYRDTYLPELLEAIAGLHPQAPTAARLLGAAAALREQLNVPLLPSDRAERERQHEEVRARHDKAAFDHAFALGRALSRDDAIKSALALMR